MACMGDRRGECKVLVRKPEGKRPVGKPRRRWVDNIRMHIEEIMGECRMPKKIFTQELEGTRRRGRPRKGWKEEVERTLQVLGARRWKEMVADRKKWKDIVRQAKAHSGL